jgi:HD-like signal output (HDOD) protein
LPILYRVEEREDLLEVPGLLDHLIEKLHARIGGEMLKQWKFPQPLVDVAAEHEDLQRSHDGPPDLVDIVQVANLQSHINDGHRLSTVDWSQVSAFQRLGLDVDLNEIELTDRISEIEEVRSLFQ